MIVKNEEEVLDRCLSCAERFADEIIIVDTGSTDRTKSIAQKFTSKIYDFLWLDDFSAARNFSFSFAVSDYIMWIDADDILTEHDIEKMLRLKKEINPEIDIVYMKYNVGFDADGNPNFSYYRERLIKHCANAVWHEPVHEAISPFGKTLYSNIAVTHKKVKPAASGRNLAIMENYIKQGNTPSPRLQYYYGRELMYNGQTEKAALVLESFLKEGNGWIENNISACKNLSDCYTKLNDTENSLRVLLKSLSYGEPRPETAYSIGTHFLNRNEYKAAAFWYETALAYKPDVHGLGFVERDYYQYLPAIQLAVTYDRLKEYDKAQKYNELAGTFKQSESYLSNKVYFTKILNKTL